MNKKLDKKQRITAIIITTILLMLVIIALAAVVISFNPGPSSIPSGTIDVESIVTDTLKITF